MTLEQELIPYFVWQPFAFGNWIRAILFLVGLALVFGYLFAMLRFGPVPAFSAVGRILRDGIVDLVRISPRRVWAMTRLAIHEAIHRKVLITFGIFVVVLLFATWFLDANSIDRAKLYLSVVLTTTSYLVLLLALFLSVFSLPHDIANRTIYTIVTKPVRRSEIVLGRMLGFSAIGTVMLSITGLISYFFVVRGVDHTHEIIASEDSTGSSRDNDDGSSVRTAQTTLTHGHRHEVVLPESGNGRTDVVAGHWHVAINKSEAGGEDRGANDEFVLGPHQDYLLARVPIYGRLLFLKRDGAPSAKGADVGKEWSYRGWFEGNTNAAAIWMFDNLSPDMFGETLPLELNLRVFRTYKGIIERGVLGSIELRNPKTGLASRPITFETKEFYSDLHEIPRTLYDRNDKQIDVFEDLVEDGRLEVVIRCLDSSQFLGAAQADVYFRASDAVYWINFVKGYVGIWLQMLLVTGLGVMFSTFLTSAVAMIANLATLLAGMFVAFITELATGQAIGGGPAESMYRIFTQMNLTSEIEASFGKTMMEMFDQGFQNVLYLLLLVLPDFLSLSAVDFVANGYNIPFDQLLIQIVTTLGYLFPVFLFGYLFLKIREIAK